MLRNSQSEIIKLIRVKMLKKEEWKLSAKKFQKPLSA